MSLYISVFLEMSSKMSRISTVTMHQGYFFYVHLYKPQRVTQAISTINNTNNADGR